MEEPTIIHEQVSSPIMTEERKARCTDLFVRIDTDGDGKLSREELEKVFGGQADECLKDCDTDEDGAISLEEWCTFLCKSGDEEFNHMIGYISDHIDHAAGISVPQEVYVTHGPQAGSTQVVQPTEVVCVSGAEAQP